LPKKKHSFLKIIFGKEKKNTDKSS